VLRAGLDGGEIAGAPRSTVKPTLTPDQCIRGLVPRDKMVIDRTPVVPRIASGFTPSFLRDFVIQSLRIISSCLRNFSFV
jgi:hypothetical protein